MEQKPDRELDKRRERHARRGSDSDDLWNGFGIDIGGMSPKAQAVTGVVTGGLILLSAALLIAFTHFWWLIFVFGWMIFPALGLLVRGIAGLSDDSKEFPASNDKERELLGALREYGELTPARAAMETSLTVAEADKMLKELAEGGHLEVRVRGGGLFYGLWEPGDEGAAQEPLGGGRG